MPPRKKNPENSSDNAKGKKSPKKYVEFSQDVADEICLRMAEGETVNNILKDDHMPTLRSVLNWRKDRPEFFTMFARARKDQMEAWADQIITLADDAEGDYKLTVTQYTRFMKFSRKNVHRADLMIKTRQWLMQRLLPELFADKQVLDIHTYEEMDDAELLHEFKTAAEASGFTLGQMVSLLKGDHPVQ